MGIFASLLSTVFAAAKDLVSKRLAHRIEGLVSTYASFAYALPFYVVLLLALWVLGEETLEVTTGFLLLVFLRAVTDTFAETLKMYAFAYADISLVISFFSLSPLFLLLTAPLITGEWPSPLGVVGVLVVGGGSVLMVNRQGMRDWRQQKIGIVLAVIAAVFFALNSNFDRLAVRAETPTEAGYLRPVFAGFAMTLLSAIFLVPWVWPRGDRRQALWAWRREFWLRGLLEIAFMVSKLYATQYLQAPYVVGIQRTSLLWSIVGGRLLFGEPDFLRRLLAGMVILAGVTLIVWAMAGSGR
ncbi:MAG: DMT family transporter [Gemmataceae bacterium]|nr:DMT family transporter [Gemmataceae bacterium]